MIATGWMVNRFVRNEARTWVLAALDDIAKTMPFPVLGSVLAKLISNLRYQITYAAVALAVKTAWVLDIPK